MSRWGGATPGGECWNEWRRETELASRIHVFDRGIRGGFRGRAELATGRGFIDNNPTGSADAILTMGRCGYRQTIWEKAESVGGDVGIRNCMRGMKSGKATVDWRCDFLVDRTAHRFPSNNKSYADTQTCLCSLLTVTPPRS